MWGEPGLGLPSCEKGWVPEPRQAGENGTVPSVLRVRPDQEAGCSSSRYATQTPEDMGTRGHHCPAPATPSSFLLLLDTAPHPAELLPAPLPSAEGQRPSV